MNKDNITPITSPAADALTELLRNGARQLIVEAVEAELEQFLRYPLKFTGQHSISTHAE